MEDHLGGNGGEGLKGLGRIVGNSAVGEGNRDRLASNCSWYSICYFYEALRGLFLSFLMEDRILNRVSNVNLMILVNYVRLQIVALHRQNSKIYTILPLSQYFTYCI